MAHGWWDYSPSRDSAWETQLTSILRSPAMAPSDTLYLGCSRQWQDSVGNWSWATSPQHKCPLILSPIPLASSLSVWPRLFRNSCDEWSSYPNPTPLWMRRGSWSLVSWGSLSEHRTTRAAILQHGRRSLGKQREEESYVSRVVFTACVRRNGLKWKHRQVMCVQIPANKAYKLSHDLGIRLPCHILHADPISPAWFWLAGPTYDENRSANEWGLQDHTAGKGTSHRGLSSWEFTW